MMRVRSISRSFVAALLPAFALCFGFCPKARAAEYRLTELTDVFGPSFPQPVALAINDAGAIVGTYVAPDGVSRPFLYQNGSVRDIEPVPNAYTTALNVNNAGQVVGVREGLLRHSYEYSNGVVNDLPNPAAAVGGAFAQAISDGGVVVGSYLDNGSPFDEYPVQWRNGVPTRVPTPGGTGAGTATGVNAAGDVVGIYWPGEDHNTANRGFVYRNGVATALGTLPGGDSSSAAAINNAGLIAGNAGTPGGAVHAALFDLQGQATDLGALGGGASQSIAFSLNDAGAVVGMFIPEGGTDNFAFVYRDGQMVDLNTLIDPAAANGFRLTIAVDVNNLGQIVGYGFRGDGGLVGYLLTPTPEPSALALLAVAGVALARPRRRTE